MFHKVKRVSANEKYELVVQFAEGVTKIYDMVSLIQTNQWFADLDGDKELFCNAKVDVGGYGIIWNDEIDISCEELWKNGTQISTPFDDLIALSDATQLWGLNESTLRKAISYGKLKDGVDVCKFGKQWVICKSSMHREYGEPKSNKK